MKGIKIIIILCITFIITGCSVDYHLLVNDKKQVIETVKFTRPNSEILQYNDSVNLYLSNQINTYKNISMFKDYEFTKQQGKDYSSIIITKQYDNFQGLKDSVIFNQLFEDAVIINNEEQMIVQTVGEYYYEKLYGDSKDKPDPTFYVGDINIKVKFYNNIIENNADIFNEIDNTLLWKITSEDKEKNIYFKIGNQKKYDIIFIDFFNRNKTVVIIIFSLITLLTFTVLYIYFFARRSNKI